MESILITGGGGYVGGHVVRHLLATGTAPHRIVVFDDFSRGHRDTVPDGVVLVEGDLRQAADVERAFADRGIGSVVHFAGLAYVGESMEQPGRYFDTNVGGGLNLLEAMRRHGCRRIVFSSTCSVYGVPSRVPITEDEPPRPINPYGESKRMFERMLAWYASAHRIGSLSLRYFNAAGAAYGLGEQHEPETHAIPLIIAAGLGTHASFTVFGTTHPTPDGSCIRDYIHVADLAEAHRLGLGWLASAGPVAEVCNLGTGVGTSVLELIALCGRLLGDPVPHRMAPARPGDPPILVAAVDRSARLLGWRAERGIERTIADAIDWHRRALPATPGTQPPGG